MFKRYLLAITFCLSSIFFFSGILYSTTQKIIKLDTHSKNTNAFIVTQYTHNPLQSTNYVQSILQYQQLAHTLQNQTSHYNIISSQPLYRSNTDFFFIDSLTHQFSQETSQIDSIQINEEAFQNNPIEIESGRAFEESDYIYSHGTSIPVLMGNKYLELYSLGDEFQAQYLYANYTFHIIGFLTDHSQITNPVRTYPTLDNYIILPSFTYINPLSSDDYTSSLLNSANQTCGIITVETTQLDTIYHQIQQLLSSYQLGDYDCYTNSSIFNYRQHGIDLPLIKNLFIFFMICSGVCLIFLNVKQSIYISQNNNIIFRIKIISSMISGCLISTLIACLLLRYLNILPDLISDIFLIPICTMSLFLKKIK